LFSKIQINAYGCRLSSIATIDCAQSAIKDFAPQNFLDAFLGNGGCFLCAASGNIQFGPIGTSGGREQETVSQTTTPTGAGWRSKPISLPAGMKSSYRQRIAKANI
jgi:hypothetical protein